jgi:hypothetical protein
MESDGFPRRRGIAHKSLTGDAYEEAAGLDLAA